MPLRVTATYLYCANIPTGTSPVSGGIRKSDVADITSNICDVSFCMTREAASLPPAVGIFSTTIWAPSIVAAESAKIRAAVDEVPPAAKPTTNVRSLTCAMLGATQMHPMSRDSRTRIAPAKMLESKVWKQLRDCRRFPAILYIRDFFEAGKRR